MSHAFNNIHQSTSIQSTDTVTCTVSEIFPLPSGVIDCDKGALSDSLELISTDQVSKSMVSLYSVLGVTQFIRASPNINRSANIYSLEILVIY